MDHQTALSSQAVERYMLNELTSPEREGFEDHFFNCSDCATALQEYEVFLANTRAVFTEDARAKPVPLAARPGPGAGFGRWFGAPALIPAFAALALAFVLLRNPAPDPAGEQVAWTLTPASRGAGEDVPHLAIAQDVVWLTPSIELSGMDPKRWASYHWALSTADGKIVDEGDRRDGQNPLALKVRASKFESGKEYRLVVQGDPATQPLVSKFVIDRK